MLQYVPLIPDKLVYILVCIKFVLREKVMKIEIGSYEANKFAGIVAASESW